MNSAPSVNSNLNAELNMKIENSNNSIVSAKKKLPIFINDLIMLFFAEICNNKDLCKIYKSNSSDANINFKTWTIDWDSPDNPTRLNAQSLYIQANINNSLYSQVNTLLRKPVKT